MDGPLVDAEPQQPLTSPPTSPPTAHNIAEEPAQAEPESEPQPAAEPHDAPVGDEPAAADAPTCRICLAGREEEAELGRLIRPCQCRGTVAHVHVQCLNSWRKSAPGSQHFWQCSQCGYKYQLVRTRALGLAKSPIVVGCSTLTLFTLLVLTTSLICSLFLPSAWIDGSAATVAGLVEEGTVDDNDYYFSQWYSSTTFANSMWKIAYQTLNEFFDDTLLGPTEAATTEASTSYRYKRDERDSAAHARAKDRARSDRIPDRATRDSVRTGPFKATASVPREARTGERTTRLRAENSAEDLIRQRRHRKPSFLMRMLRRFLLGLAIVGAFSFATFGFAFTMPLNWIRRRAGRGRGEGNDNSLYAILIIIFLFIGVGKALWFSYKATTALTTALLMRAETAILEPNSTDDEPIPLNETEPPLLAFLSRPNLRRAVTRQFWVDLWWTVARFMRGAYEVVRDAVGQLQARDIAGIVLGLLALFAGTFGAGGGVVWEIRL